MEEQKVGFIGLGRMGQLMAGLLLDAGFPLTIWNRTMAKTVDLGKRGAKVASSPKEVAAQSDIIITIILDDAALEAVSFGENGILAGACAGSILVEMSTLAPKKTSSRVASAAEERGMKMLRAPVSGTTNWAEEGKLTILVSGDRQAFEKCQKVFDVLGEKTFYLGTGEEALYHKLLLNMMVATTSQILAESVTFGKLAGLDLYKMVEVIRGSAVASPTLCHRAERIARQDFARGASVKMLAKDLDLALGAGRKLRSPMPVTGLVHQFLSIMEATGRSELDHSALALLMQDLSQTKD